METIKTKATVTITTRGAYCDDRCAYIDSGRCTLAGVVKPVNLDYDADDPAGLCTRCPACLQMTGTSVTDGKGRKAKQQVVVTIITRGPKYCGTRCPYRESDDCFLGQGFVTLRYDDDLPLRSKYCLTAAAKAAAASTPPIPISVDEADVDSTRFAMLEVCAGPLSDDALGKKLRPLLPALKVACVQLQETLAKLGEVLQNLDTVAAPIAAPDVVAESTPAGTTEVSPEEVNKCAS